MQVERCLELRIDGRLIAEDQIEKLGECPGFLGRALEIENAGGEETHVAWFAIGEDEWRRRAEVSAALALSGIPASACRIRSLEEADWSTAWQKDWHGIGIGQRLWVRPSFCPAAKEGRIDIQLDPGMAFGTGTHATTRLCLIAIEEICAAFRPASLLDMGAGSGILAIAALKLGVGRALAIDIEEAAVDACRANARLNDVDLEVRLGDSPPDSRFDLVVANILAGPLIDMAPSLSQCVGSHLILSGLLEDQIGAVRAAYENQGLDFEAASLDEGWAALRLRRP